MATVKKAIGNGWTELSATLSGLTVLQITGSGAAVVEVTTATTTPTTEDGVYLGAGDTLTGDVLSALGATGDTVYAKKLSGNNVYARMAGSTT